MCSHYGERPNFVLLGGLVPAMLCSDSDRLHAGTTDVDVQVDLEIAAGAEHARRLEIALKNADFRADSERMGSPRLAPRALYCPWGGHSSMATSLERLQWSMSKSMAAVRRTCEKQLPGNQ